MSSRCFFSPTFMYLHLAVDRWDSISSTEESHVNRKDSIILYTWRWFIISIDICHILMTKCVGASCKSLFPTGTQIWWRDCNNGPSGHMNQQSLQHKCYHSPPVHGAQHTVKLKLGWVTDWVKASPQRPAAETLKQAQHIAREIDANRSWECPLHGIDVFIHRTRNAADKSGVRSCEENAAVCSESMKGGKIALQRVYREECQGERGYQRLQGTQWILTSMDNTIKTVECAQ